MLLQQRLDTISNHTLRDLDPSTHLAELQRVSEELDEFKNKWSMQLDPRLRHFLTSASFTKALEWIDQHQDSTDH